MIDVNDLSMSFGEKPLYEKVCFSVAKNQKVGLVGQNGSGKSTLLKILTSQEDGYKGKVVVKGVTAFVPQEVKLDKNLEMAKTVRNYVDPSEKCETYKLKRLFAGLELDLELSHSPQNISGGQKTKLALARALLAKPDILLLDEPTNFMDTAGKAFVMDFLSKYEGTVIVISHDLELMDKAIDKLLFINSQTKIIEEFKGNYTKAMKLKAEKDALMKRNVIAEKKHIKSMEEGIKRLYRYTSKKGVRARVMLQKRIELAKESLPDLPAEVKKIKVDLPEPAKVGKVPVRAININKSFGNQKVLKDIDFTLVRNEKIAFIGPNGSGKSTFIKILVGLLEADSGQVIKNEKLKIGFYSQEFETLDFSKAILDVFCEYTKKDERFARAFLGRYMFLGNKVYQRIESLSGGEKTRFSTALLTGVDNNLLILDEPTTYLDVVSQKVILEALKSYKGTMIIVSHTPDFIKGLSPDKAFLFPEQKMVYWDDSLLNRVLEV